MAISQEQRQQVVELMQAGQSWSGAIERVGVKVCEATAYRWIKCWRQGGEAGLSDGRHGHISKMTPEIRAWLKDYCGQAQRRPVSKAKPSPL